MRHPHGLRAAATPPAIPIGTSMEGGFFAGYISHTANGVATHALILSPKTAGGSGGGYPNATDRAWKTINTDTPNTNSLYDGVANTNAMDAAGLALHPNASFCRGLSIGGYTDWYMPAILEFDIAYYNLKPTTTANNTSYGTNIYAVPPRNSNWLSGGPPTQTTLALFQSGGAEELVNSLHWSSTQSSATTGIWMNFQDGQQLGGNNAKDQGGFRARAFRRVAL